MENQKVLSWNCIELNGAPQCLSHLKNHTTTFLSKPPLLHLYVFGGYDIQSKSNSNLLHKIDLKTQNVETVQSMSVLQPIPVNGHTGRIFDRYKRSRGFIAEAYVCYTLYLWLTVFTMGKTQLL